MPSNKSIWWTLSLLGTLCLLQTCRSYVFAAEPTTGSVATTPTTASTTPSFPLVLIPLQAVLDATTPARTRLADAHKYYASVIDNPPNAAMLFVAQIQSRRIKAKIDAIDAFMARIAEHRVLELSEFEFSEIAPERWVANPLKNPETLKESENETSD